MLRAALSLVWVGALCGVFVLALSEPVPLSLSRGDGAAVPRDLAPEQAACSQPAPASSGAEPAERPRAPDPSVPPEPTQGAVEQLEALVGAEDVAGLRAFVREDGSWARFEALRRLLALGGAAELPDLLDLMDGSDAALHELVGDACGAGGSAQIAELLADRLGALSTPTARRAAAGAILEIAGEEERGSVSLRARQAAVEVLVAAASADDLLEAEEACWALARGGSEVRGPLHSLGKDRGLDPGVRLAAIEASGGQRPQRELYLALAQDHPEHPAGRLALIHARAR